MRHRVARHAGVRTARYKLIHFYTDDTWELYDLEADPHELQDVVEQPGYQGVVIEMKTIYERLKQKYTVPEEVFHPPFALVGKG